MKRRTQYSLMGIVVTVPFVIIGWYFVFTGSLRGFLFVFALYAVFWPAFVGVLSWGRRSPRLREAPWETRCFQIGAMNDYVRGLLGVMRVEREKCRKSFRGKTLKNRLLVLDQPAARGKWELWIETYNDTLAAYSVGFVSEDNPFLDVGRSKSGSKAVFLAMGG